MKDNKIDKLFKEKAAQGSFAYKDSYWKGAEKLIVAKQAAAGSGFWSIGTTIGVVAVITLVGIGSALWFTQPTSNTNPVELNESPLRIKESTLESNSFESKNDITSTEESSTENNEELPTNRNEKANSARPQTTSGIQENANVVSANKAQPKSTVPVTDKGQDSETAQIAGNTAGEKQRYSATTETPVAIQAIAAKNEGAAQENATASTVNKKEEEENAAGADVVETTEDTENSAAGSEISAAAQDSEHNDESKVIGLTEPKEEPYAETQTEGLSKTNTESNAAPLSSEAKKEDIILPHQAQKDWLFSIGADYSYLFTSRTVTGSPANYIDFRNGHESASSSSSIGLQFVAEHQHWIFHSGVYQTTFTDNVAYPQTLEVLVGVDNGTWFPQENWTYTIDSSWQVTGIYQGGWNYDTTWSVTYDSSYVPQWDSVLTEKEDPSLVANNGRSTFSYIEVPFWFGRTFGEGRWQLMLQGGASVGILSGTKGSVYINQRVDGLVSPAYQLEQFNQFTYYAMFRAGVRFDISPQVQATLAPMLRYSLNSVLKGEGIKQRYFGYGINLGVSYRF